MISFKVSEDIKHLGIKGTYFLITGMSNNIQNSDFEYYKKSAIEDLGILVNSKILEENSVLTGFRDLHNKIGRSNKKYVASPENLINYFLKNNDIPRINLIVDIYNLVSIKSSLAIGAHDIVGIYNNVTLKYTDGSEKYVPLGQKDTKKIIAGDYSYIDDNNEIICHLEVRQVEKTKVGLETSDCFYIVQGNSNTDSNYIENVVQELIQITTKYCGGNAQILYRL